MTDFRFRLLRLNMSPAKIVWWNLCKSNQQFPRLTHRLQDFPSYVCICRQSGSACSMIVSGNIISTRQTCYAEWKARTRKEGLPPYHKVPSTSKTTPFNFGRSFVASCALGPSGANLLGSFDNEAVIMNDLVRYLCCEIWGKMWNETILSIDVQSGLFEILGMIHRVDVVRKKSRWKSGGWVFIGQWYCTSICEPEAK